MTHRLAIVVSHPIQHFVPFYRALAADPLINLTVIFCSRIGLEPYFDHGMNTVIAWKMDLLSGYDYVFLPEAGNISATGGRKVTNPSVAAELDRIDPDAVLINGYSHATSRRALRWCRKKSVPALLIADSSIRTPRHFAKRWIKSLVLPRLLRGFSAFLTVSDCNEEYYLKYGVPSERLFRSPFTIDESSYSSARAGRVEIRQRTRKERHVSDDTFIVLTVGKLSARKRPTDVLEVARKLKSHALSIRFWLAGMGELHDKLAAQIEAEGLPVDLLGFVNVDELPKLYQASDLLLHCARIEPFGLVVPEAASSMLPMVLSSAVGALGPKSPAREGENAFVFEPGNVDLATKHVARIAKDPQLHRTMSFRSLAIYDELDMAHSVLGAKAALAFVCSSKPRLESE